MTKKLTLCLILAVTAIFIAACGLSFEKEKVKAEERVKEAFINIPESNKNLESIQLNLPAELVIKEEKPNNIILEKGSHPYILFYNQHENMKSEELYKHAKSNVDQILVDRTFKENDRFGYLLIIDAGNNEYQITAGVGGVKASTKSKLNTLVKDSELLMEMASSAIIND